MASEDELKSSSEQAQTAPVADGPPKGRRPGRGYRGRGRRHRGRRPTQNDQSPAHLESSGEPPRPEEPPRTEEASEPESVHAAPETEDHRDLEGIPVRSEPEPIEALREVPEPPATLLEGIEQVNKVIESLRESLEEMEELLELLETLERQTGADQREIDSLRRALRQLHQPRAAAREGSREGGRGHSHSR